MAGNQVAEPDGGDDTRPDASPFEPESLGDAPVTMPLSAWTPDAEGEPAQPPLPAVPAVLPAPSAPAGNGAGYGPPSYGPPSYGPPSYGLSSYGPPGYPPGQGGMRASAADRERTIDVLRAAYGEGRLSREEFETRTGRTMSAKHYGELAAIIADLPVGPLGQSGPGYYPAIPAQPTNGMAAGSLVCSLIGMLLPPMLVSGVVMGHVARGQIRATGQRGDGFAVAGLVLGYLGIVLWTLVIVFLIAG